MATLKRGDTPTQTPGSFGIRFRTWFSLWIQLVESSVRTEAGTAREFDSDRVSSSSHTSGIRRVTQATHPVINNIQ
jgi:hypothetical protein